MDGSATTLRKRQRTRAFGSYPHSSEMRIIDRPGWSWLFHILGMPVRYLSKVFDRVLMIVLLRFSFGPFPCVVSISLICPCMIPL